MARVPLTSRPLDLVYFIYFLTHIPASLLMDFQPFYPREYTPEFIAQLPLWYVEMSNDPFVGGALGLFGNSEHLIWFKSFVALEIVFQVPVFILGMHGLYKNSRSIYTLLIIYAASTATTTFPCLTTIFALPVISPETILTGSHSVTTEQKWILLSCYAPYLIIPLVMTLDMAGRIGRLVKAGMKAQDDRKGK